MAVISQTTAVMLVAAIITTCLSVKELAEKICAKTDKSHTVGVWIYSSRMGEMNFKFECNEAKTAFTRCIPTGANPEGYPRSLPGMQDLPPDGFPVSTKPTDFGGQFGTLYEMDCSATATPTRIAWRMNFADEVCNTEKKSKEYKAGQDSKPVTITFVCDAENSEIKVCKGSAKNGKKIAAKSTGKIDGVKIYCDDHNEPTFPEK